MLLTLLEGLDRRRWSTVLFHHDGPEIAPLLQGAGRLGVRTRSVRRPEGAGGIPLLIREVRSERAEVFHAHLSWPLRCSLGLVASALAGVPAVVATQQLFAKISSPSQIVRQRLVAGGVDRYIAVSREMARNLRATPFFPARKIEVIHNAILLERFEGSSDGALRETLAGRSGRPVVLTLARLDPQKGLFDLLEAAALVSEAVFVLAGEGPERERLEGRTRALGIQDRVVFLGHCENAPELLASCDLFVLPSLYEGLPVSVLEAMAAGKPVVATAIGGTDEAVVDGETGLLVPARNPTALAGAIRAVLRDSALSRRLGSAGRERARKCFSAEMMVRRVSSLYEEILSARPSRAREA
jgi:glycosyltransferase involved in cell wall biosynthesis